MSTRPDDESNDKPDGDDAPGASNDDASREERVRGGFHQADSSRPGGPARSRKDKDDGTSDEPRRRAGRRRTDDEEDEPVADDEEFAARDEEMAAAYELNPMGFTAGMKFKGE